MSGGLDTNLKKNSKIKGRFSTIIITRFLLFSVITLILTIIAMNIVLVNYRMPRTNVQVEKLAKAYSKQDISKYSKIKVYDFLGENSIIQILNDNKEIIFSNNKESIGQKYTDEELSMISNYKNQMTVRVFDFNESPNENRKLITVERLNDDRTTDTRIMIIDNNLNVIYSSAGMENKQLSAKEYRFLSETATNKYSFSKITFTDKDGKMRTMICYSPKGYKANFGRMYDSAKGILFDFGFLYILLLIKFTYFLYRKLYKPFKLLDKTMYEVKIEGPGHQIEYSGPKEFVNIIDRFNEMSSALYAAELENQRLSHEKEKIISDISHDLKIPITVIQGYSKAIQDGLVAEKDIPAYLEKITKKTEQLNSLINEFHEYMVMERADYIPSSHPTDLGEYLRSYLADNFDQFEHYGYAIEIDIPEQEFFCNIETTKMNRAFDNLLNNFFKYTPPGSTLFCKVHFTRDEAIVLIGDNGTGIKPSIANTLFEPFVTSNAARTDTTIHSSGLGLAFVKKIIEAHGGTIELNPKPPKDLTTQFIIRFIASKTKI